jgi:hypothetical protein
MKEYDSVVDKSVLLFKSFMDISAITYREYDIPPMMFYYYDLGDRIMYATKESAKTTMTEYQTSRTVINLKKIKETQRDLSKVRGIDRTVVGNLFKFSTPKDARPPSEVLDIFLKPKTCYLKLLFQS